MHLHRKQVTFTSVCRVAGFKAEIIATYIQLTCVDMKADIRMSFKHTRDTILSYTNICGIQKYQ